MNTLCSVNRQFSRQRYRPYSRPNRPNLVLRLRVLFAAMIPLAGSSYAEVRSTAFSYSNSVRLHGGYIPDFDDPRYPNLVRFDQSENDGGAVFSDSQSALSIQVSDVVPANASLPPFGGHAESSMSYMAGPRTIDLAFSGNSSYQRSPFYESSATGDFIASASLSFLISNNPAPFNIGYASGHGVIWLTLSTAEGDILFSTVENPGDASGSQSFLLSPGSYLLTYQATNMYPEMIHREDGGYASMHVTVVPEMNSVGVLRLFAVAGCAGVALRQKKWR